MKKIAIFASGRGTNTKNILEYYKDSQDISVNLVVASRQEAGVVEVAKEKGVETIVITKDELISNPHSLVSIIKSRNIDLIVLAGYMLHIPDIIIDEFPDKIINIHPSLLPKFGGKGMYGDNVHKAVIASKEKESGITIQYVNKIYDNGAIIFQAKCIVDENDTYETLAKKIHALEYKYYPIIISKILQDDETVTNI